MSRLGTVAVAVVSVALLAPAGPARAAVASRPPASYFGVHYGGIGRGDAYPDATGVGAVRLWETGTSWTDVQPTRHAFRFDVLDRAVANARAHGDSVLYVFGWVPRWAAAPVRVGTGPRRVRAGSPPRSDAQWVAYVTRVARRYRGRVTAYEVWNEANLTGFYAGSIPRMVHLAGLAYRAIKRVDPHAVVTSPSVTVRGGGGRRWMRAYARAGGLRFADVINVHLYPHPDAGPEAVVALLKDFRFHLRKVPGGHKPVWNTEINYGLPRRGTPRLVPIPEEEQVAYVLRTYLLGWSQGVRRIYWFDWSDTKFLGVHMTAGDGTAAAGPPGRALTTVRTWMHGRLRPCTVNRRATYRCLVDYGRGRRGVVRWNPRRPVVVHAPVGTTALVDQAEVARTVLPGAAVPVGSRPVLFRYRT